MSEIAALFSNVGNITLPEVVMWIIGGVLIYLGIRKKMEPSLLVPMGFGAILVNLPMSAAVTQKVAGVIEEGPLDILFSVCSTKPLPKSRTTLDTRGERLRCFEFDEMDGI